jgi:predicted HAD superfamily hydrolase
MSWARNICSKFQINLEPNQLFDIRKNAEKNLKNNTDKDETTYSELINCILIDLEQQEIFINNRDEFYKTSLEIEFLIEKQNIYLDESTIERAKNEKTKNRIIVLISDFYLPKIFFEKILEYFNLQSLFDKIYISSELGLRKSTGRLYSYILDDLELTPPQLLMIGDNKKSDYGIPLKQGIEAEWRSFHDKTIFYGTNVEKAIDDLLKKKYNNNEFVGYIPAICLFMERLYKTARKDNCNKLLFCSREGQNLKYLFDLYQKTMYEQNQIETEYLYVSRRATMLPALSDLETEKFEVVFRHCQELSISDFLYSVGFENDEILSVINNSGLSCSDMVSYDNKAFHKLLENANFNMIYDKKRKIQKQYFRDYLKNINNDILSTIYIVDIGWRGTIQDNIFRALDEKSKIIGYYFGIFDCETCEKNQKKGLMFQETPKTDRYELYSYNNIELERVFAANHGQVLFYEMSETGKVRPKLSKAYKDIQIYEYVSSRQKTMNTVFENIVNIFNASYYNPENIEKYLSKKYLYQICVIEPKHRKMYLKFREKTNENFGNISCIKLKADNSNTRDKNLKRKYFYVYYSYRLLDRFNLFFFHPVAYLYCRMIYILKRISI